MTRKTAPKPPQDAVSDLQRITATCAKVVTAIDEHVNTAVASRTVSKAERDKATYLIVLGRGLTQMACELRKVEAHEAKTELSDVTVLEFHRKQTPTARAGWLKDIAAMDRKTSVLG